MKVCIIPARGNSKRLPRKNVLPINGRPMISYPIATAQNSGLFREVLVSTEDQEIARVAEECGARVISRPGPLYRDAASVSQVCIHVMQNLGYDVESFCCLYATALFVTVDDLVESGKLLDETDFVMGVSEYNYSWHHALALKDDYLRPADPRNLKHKAYSLEPRQPMFASNGTFYWSRPRPFMALKSFYGPRLKGYEIPQSRAIDVDTDDDLQIARSLAAMRFPTPDNA